jgi:hypothetical protein
MHIRLFWHQFVGFGKIGIPAKANPVFLTAGILLPDFITT